MQQQKTSFDITLPMREGMVVYPGNPAFTLVPRVGSTSVHSELSLGTHTGTHVDAPLHVFAGGQSVDTLPLSPFIGPCRVLDMTHVAEALTVQDFEAHAVRAGERILTKTRNSLRGFQKFYSDYVYLSGEAAEYLAERATVLFGIDYLSVKKRGGMDNRAHTALLGAGVVVFEGLDLSAVDAGEYEFVGLPLRIAGGDGAPARAVLVR